MQGGWRLHSLRRAVRRRLRRPHPAAGTHPDKSGTRLLYSRMRAAFQDFHAEIHWQSVERDLVTTYKTYRGTRRGTFPGRTNPPAAQSLRHR
ncbi:hypothetical protein GS540_31110 [Rhodococcus hoagii]|nr:hypothetical protein [Prescottella equi]